MIEDHKDYKKMIDEIEPYNILNNVLIFKIHSKFNSYNDDIFYLKYKKDLAFYIKKSKIHHIKPRLINFISSADDFISFMEGYRHEQNSKQYFSIIQIGKIFFEK